MDSETVKLNFLTLGELENEQALQEHWFSTPGVRYGNTILNFLT